MRDSDSITSPPLTSAPSRASRAIAEAMAAGVASTRAQGQATISAATVRIISPVNR